LSYSNDFIMELNVNNLVRSAVVLAVGLPLSIGLSSNLTRQPEEVEPTVAEMAISDFRDQVTGPCLRWAFSASDTKAEREAKNAIDEVVGEGADYRGVCGFVL
jgi:hypothetical protein